MMQRAQPSARGNCFGGFGVMVQVPRWIEVDAGTALRAASIGVTQVVLERPLRRPLDTPRRIELRVIEHRVEQIVADTALFAAMLQIMVVAVGMAISRQLVIADIAMELAIQRFAEQPVWRADPKACPAIGIKSGLRMAFTHGGCSPGVSPHVPDLVEPQVRRVT